MLLPLASAGCAFLHDPLKPFSPTTVQRGIFIDPDRLKELNPGTTTRADVETLLGTPTAKGSFDDNTWIYVAETTHTRIGRMPGVSKQNVLVLSFDEGGVLRGVKGLDQKDAQDVDMVERTTPSPGTEASVMQQLLGNIGKFNPTGAPTSGGSGGLNGPGL
jgi:outer membrane protein assembly factor BamE (lipoprotein component of BamABCDE complex)